MGAHVARDGNLCPDGLKAMRTRVAQIIRSSYEELVEELAA